MRMLLPGIPERPVIDRLHQRIWLHLGSHWHAPTRQLAGPMSRCYQTDIGSPLWIQKAVGGAIPFASLEEIKARRVSIPGEIATLDYECPKNVLSLFLQTPSAHQHRELFTGTVVGTTWLTPIFCLGSANQSDFWVQRRPLLAYWGGDARPAHYLQLRVMHDDYDFASALFYSVQDKENVAGAINFRTPGGDKHPSLDPVKDGAFAASRIAVHCELAGVPYDAERLADGISVGVGAKLRPQARLAIELGGLHLHLQFVGAAFADDQATLSLTREKNLLVISLDLLAKPRTVRWTGNPRGMGGVHAFSARGRDLASGSRHPRGNVEPQGRSGAVGMAQSAVSFRRLSA